jgi:hypothetical protein
VATTSSWKTKVEKGVPKGQYNEHLHGEKVDLDVQASSIGKRATGRRLGINDDDDAMTDEGADDDDDDI